VKEWTDPRCQGVSENSDSPHVGPTQDRIKIQHFGSRDLGVSNGIQHGTFRKGRIVIPTFPLDPRYTPQLPNCPSSLLDAMESIQTNPADRDIPFYSASACSTSSSRDHVINGQAEGFGVVEKRALRTALLVGYWHGFIIP